VLLQVSQKQIYDPMILTAGPKGLEYWSDGVVARPGATCVQYAIVVMNIASYHEER
jgi:hypothetical protein